MKAPFIKNVCLASAHSVAVGSYRQGTVFLSIEQFARKFGNPHAQDFSEDGIDGAGKVHAQWTIKTPRGLAEVHDYWWNAEEQLSLCAPNYYAYLWAKNWLRVHGAVVARGCGK